MTGPPHEPVDVDGLVSDEMVQRAWTGVLHALPGTHQHPGDDVLRVVLAFAAALAYEQCAAELRRTVGFFAAEGYRAAHLIDTADRWAGQEEM